ncbi:MAG TPA: alanine--tRNA ligase, partial [Alphaproteobacteria bacterium]|nr:alanine--tRNA ligase [Alphaproteobacteria bacterium]
RTPLPRPSIDTGMGLERIAAVLQGKHDNYDIDLMRGLIEASAEVSGTDPDGPHAVSHRVIADHLRATSFLIADGVLPSNEGRGYVLRRIMRRAMRHAHLLGCTEPLMWRLFPALAERMGAAYPELLRARPLIVETLKLEETRFKATLERGLKLLEEASADLPKTAPLPGEVAFKLYDTFGFPLDLTADVLRGQGRGVDTDGFNRAMERQRAEARKAWAGSGEQATGKLWFELRDELGATEFLGYDTVVAEGVVRAILVEGKRVERANAGQKVELVFNQTPFYAESGGQMGDAGVAIGAEGVEVEISDTQKKAGELFVHDGIVRAGTLALGNAVELRVDRIRRDKLRANHSATHLLHRALRKTLGDHVTQKGSLVAPDRLRFDISQPRPLSPEEIVAVEGQVNAQIRRNTDVTTRLMTPDAAVKAGALALFGEKYGDEVRVLSMGSEVGGEEEGEPYSTELCGGTHVRRTGDIGFFKIVSEQALASGVRRIEALTGEDATLYVEREERLLDETAALLKIAPAELPARVASLVEDRKRLERELSELRKKLASGGGAGAAAPAAKEVGGIKFAARLLDGVPARELKAMADALKKQVGSGVVAIAAEAEGKASLVVGVTDDLTGRLSAVDFVRVGAEKLGGKGGGGRPDMAQAGGPDVGARQAALDAIEAALAAHR